jgi:hypothetical protein
MMVQTALIANANARSRAFAFGSILPDAKICKETQTFEMATLRGRGGLKMFGRWLNGIMIRVFMVGSTAIPRVIVGEEL